MLRTLSFYKIISQGYPFYATGLESITFAKLMYVRKLDTLSCELSLYRYWFCSCLCFLHALGWTESGTCAKILLKHLSVFTRNKWDSKWSVFVTDGQILFSTFYWSGITVLSPSESKSSLSMGQGKILTPVVTHLGELMNDDVIALSSSFLFSPFFK